MLGELKRRGQAAALFDVATALTTHLRATVGREPLQARISNVNLSDVRSVWLRRVSAPKSLLAGQAGGFAASEASSFLRSLGAALKDRKWVNPLGAALATDGGTGKLSQLEVARQCGLEIPETLATNSPEEARAFVAAQGDAGAIYKPFESPHLVDKRVIFTKRVGLGDDFSQVLVSPCLFQALVPKRCDVRGVVLGDRVLAAEIHSQAHPDSALDFRRRYALGETKYVVASLPRWVETAVLAVHRTLGLVMGCFDLIATPDGRWVFLETNQMGQFLWLQDQLPELRLVEGVADLLTV